MIFPVLCGKVFDIFFVIPPLWFTIFFSRPTTWAALTLSCSELVEILPDFQISDGGYQCECRRKQTSVQSAGVAAQHGHIGVLQNVWGLSGWCSRGHHWTYRCAGIPFCPHSHARHIQLHIHQSWTQSIPQIFHLAKLCRHILNIQLSLHLCSLLDIFLRNCACLLVVSWLFFWYLKLFLFEFNHFIQNFQL